MDFQTSFNKLPCAGRSFHADIVIYPPLQNVKVCLMFCFFCRRIQGAIDTYTEFINVSHQTNSPQGKLLHPPPPQFHVLLLSVIITLTISISPLLLATRVHAYQHLSFGELLSFTARTCQLEVSADSAQSPPHYPGNWIMSNTAPLELREPLGEWYRLLIEIGN